MSTTGIVYYCDPFIVEGSPNLCFAPSRQEKSGLPIHPCCYSQDAAAEWHSQHVEHRSFYHHSVALVHKYTHVHLSWPAAQTGLKFWSISKKLNSVKDTSITSLCGILKDRSKHWKWYKEHRCKRSITEGGKKKKRGTEQPKNKITTRLFVIPVMSLQFWGTFHILGPFPWLLALTFFLFITKP